MLRHAFTHGESVRCCERSSLHAPNAGATTAAGLRSCTDNAAGNNAVAHRTGTTALKGKRSASSKGFPLGSHRPHYGKSGPVATRSRTPQRFDASVVLSDTGREAQQAILVIVRFRADVVAMSARTCA